MLPAVTAWWKILPSSSGSKRAFRFDYIGFSLLMLGVSALQIFLDKGQEDDWFGSRFIATLVIASSVSLVGLVLWEWRQRQPIVDVRLFKNVNFSASCVHDVRYWHGELCEHCAYAAVFANV